MRRMILAAALVAAFSAGALGDEKGGGLLVTAKVGGIVPVDGLSPFVSGGLEIGYRLPVLKHALAIVIEADYTQPTKTGSEMDPRVAGGAYTWKLTEQELAIMPLLEYRATFMGSLVPYAGIGPRVYLLKSTVQSNNAMPKINDTTEKSTKVGVGIPLGAELKLGPGHALAEVLLQYGPLDHKATGDSNTGAVSLSLGYRFLF